ncbi:cryptochrome/photolyase family protein [Marinicella rhabdoformis]|uniref:cryptochrome/photolyase family protein n=1 Tax=Marinicella rhabdoformis TaxID=2580566 RepID=UPI0012AED436|nr:deoxyribodipyrimidine photo-lyase [Marinicella rhabdoformis]
MNLVWFRNDLRLADNPALWHALETGKPVLAVYCDCQSQHQQHHESELKVQFRQAHVFDLSERLKCRGIELKVLNCDDFSSVPKQLQALWQSKKIEKLFYNRNYLVNESDRDDAVSKLAEEDGVEIHHYDANYLLPPETIRKNDGSMYHVFTPYKNKFLNHLLNRYDKPYEMHPRLSLVTGKVEQKEQLIASWKVGEVAAFNQLKRFTTNADYEKFRDRPDVAGTSQLSPYLAIGAISAKQCLAYWLKFYGPEAFESKWVSELIWRDFYANLCHQYPKLVKGYTFKEQAVDDWQNNMVFFEAWKKGETGFPIIDAGIRQMLTTGWMHNRVRMLVASFLTKLCLADWRLGERFFMQHLIDGDFASNNGGWQWSSATGCDAAPYFRIFNPMSQSKKFDPEGQYIKTYLPELESLTPKEIHQPNSHQIKACGYVKPIFNYKERRVMCLEWYSTKKNVKKA